MDKAAAARFSNKPFREMSDAELREQWALWDAEVRNAPGWGAAVATADSFRGGCEAELKRRGLSPQPNPPSPGLGAEHR